MKTIELSSGKVAIVDDEDYELLKDYHWTFDGRYACRSNWNKEYKKESKIYMHKQIMGDPPASDIKLHIDHIDRNKLNNTRGNLRFVSQKQNNRNVGPKNKYKGVTKVRTGKFAAYIFSEGTRHHLGTFIDEKEAARVYNARAKELFGEYAYLNEIED